MNRKLTNFAFVGLLGLNMFKPTALLNVDSTPVGSARSGLLNRMELKAQNLENTRGVLKNVKVTAVSSSSLTIDNEGTSVKVNILSKTQLRRRFWGKSSLSEFSVGDSIDVVGKWTDDTKTAINAVLIRNLSIQKRFGVFFGTVKSTTPDGFVMTTIQRGDEAVTFDSTAKLINRKQLSITQADIVVGARVRVRGLWDSNAKTITGVKEIKDFSLPPRGSGEPEESEKPKVKPTGILFASPTASPLATATP